MSAAAATVLRRKRLVRAFREAGATDADRAVTLEQLGQRRSWIFEQMRSHGVFLATDADRYFLNERAAADFLAVRRRRALVFAGIGLLIFVALWLLGLL